MDASSILAGSMGKTTKPSTIRDLPLSPGRTPYISLPSLLTAVGLILLALAAFAPALWSGFIWDDDDYVYRNLALRTVAGLWNIWTQPGTVPQYYPLTHTTFWIEHQLWGNHPAGYHLTNIILHGISSIVLWRLLLRLGVPGALVIAALFAVHPMQVESVAWITERKNILSGLFYLAAFSVYWPMLDDSDPHHPPRPTLAKYSLAFALFVAALLSKSVACTLPAALLLVLWWKRGALRRQDILPLVPLFLVGAAMGAATSFMERTVVGAVGADFAFSFAQRILIAGQALCFYAAKLLFPHHLTFIYPRFDINPANAALWLYPAGVLLALLGLFLLRKRVGRGPLAAALFFCGTLAPALGFFNIYPMLYSFVADHFQYLACIGLFALIVGAVASIARLPKPLATAAAILAILVASVLTFNQTRIYENPRTLWADTLHKNPAAWMASSNLANELLIEATDAAPEKRAQLATQAKSLCLSALKYRAGSPTATLNLGRALDLLGDTPQAVQIWQSLIDSDAIHSAANGKRATANAHYQIGRSLLTSNQPIDAAKQFQMALNIVPAHTDAMTQLAAVRARQGDFSDALALLKNASQLDPDSPTILTNLGNLYYQAGQLPQATDAYQQALILKPDHLPARYGLAITLASAGQLASAETILRDLNQSHPDSPQIVAALATVLNKQAKTQEAAQLRQSKSQSQSK